jgi:DNA-binding NarL/FixJ family response regulator
VGVVVKAFGSVARPVIAAEIEPTASGLGQLGGHVQGARPINVSRVAGFRGLPALHVEVAPSEAQSTVRECLRHVRVLIVDDCTLYRDSLAAALTASSLPVVGYAWDLATLVAKIHETQVDVVLLNIATADSTALVSAALATDPELRVVVIGVPDDDELGVIACAEAGVVGYHTRTESFDDLLALVGTVAAGQSLCSPRVSAMLLRRLSTLAAGQQAAAKELVLTAREAQILTMLKMGLSNRDIADQLCIAVHTVKNHVHSVLTKLGVNTRGEAVALAHGIGDGAGPPENQSRST